MRLAAPLIALLLFACVSPRAKCERLARRLMPDPTPEFVAQCVDRSRDRDTAKAIDCLLAVGPEGIFEKDLERCEAKRFLPIYFQF